MASISLIFVGQFVDVAIPTEFVANDLVRSPPSEHRALYLNAWNRLSLSSIVAPKDFVVSTSFTQVPFVVLSLWPDPITINYVLYTLRVITLAFNQVCKFKRCSLRPNGTPHSRPPMAPSFQNQLGKTTLLIKATLPLYSRGQDYHCEKEGTRNSNEKRARKTTAIPRAR